MHSIKRLISKSDYILKSGCNLKVFLKLKKPRQPQKTQKTPKNPLGWFFLNPGFFQPCLCLAAVQRLMNWSRAIMELSNRKDVRQ